MKLYYQGNLGINETNPTHKLHVGGGATFTSTAYFDNLDVKTTATFNGNVNYNGTINLDGNIGGTPTFTNNATFSGGCTLSGGAGYGATVFPDSEKVMEFRVPALIQDDITGLSTNIGSILYNKTINMFVGYGNTGWAHLSI